MPECYAIRESYLRDYLIKINSITDEQMVFARALETPIRQLTRQRGDYMVIDVIGTLVDAPSFISTFFGYSQTTYSQILEAIEQVKASDAQKVIFAIDSNGGYVAKGLDDVWKGIRELSKSKVVAAVNVGMMASAAYWIASAAPKIYSASPLTEQGSIGVYASFFDWTEYDKKSGIKEVIVVSKNAPLKHLPTDDERLVEQIQERLDNVEKVFLSSVAEGRDLDVDYIVKNFGQGAILSNEKAEKVGMIDGVVDSLDKVFSADTSVSAEDKPIDIRGDQVPSLKELLDANPEACAEHERAIQTALDDGRAAVRTELKEALPFVGNANYSEHVRNLATQVVEGKATNDKLKGAAEYEDQIKAAAALSKTQAETADLPETPALKPKVNDNPGVIADEESYKAAVDRERKMQGRA